MAAHGNRISETILPPFRIGLLFTPTTTTCQASMSERWRCLIFRLQLALLTRFSYVENPVGGWKWAAGKQFWDGVDGESVCGAHLDWDWSATPFW
jgi:hypothetical protein